MRGIIGSLLGISLLGGCWLFSRRLSAEIDAVFGFPFGDVPMLHEELAAPPTNGQAGSGRERGSAAGNREDRTHHAGSNAR